MSATDAASQVGQASQAMLAVQASQAAMALASAPQSDWGAWAGYTLQPALAVKAADYETLDNIGNGAREDCSVWEHRQILAACSERQLVVEQTVLLRLSLQKLRQIEKATYHQEGRQDSGTGLPSDQDRHVEQFKAEMAAARQCRDEGGQAVIQSRYRTARRDSIHRAASQSCFSFCEAWCRLPKRL